MDRTEAAARIRKVLALTASSNEHEAALAALRVQQLLAQWHLTLDEVQADAIGETRRTSDGPWQDTLLRIVAKACGCTTVTLVPRDGPTLVSLVGTTLDRETATAMYERIVIVLERRTREAWQAHVESLTDPELGVHPALKEEGAEAEWKGSFIAGALTTLLAQVADPKEHRFCAHPGRMSLDALVPVTDVRQKAIERAMVFATKLFGTLRVRQTAADLTLLPSAMKSGGSERLT